MSFDLPNDANDLRAAHAAGERNFSGVRIDGAQLAGVDLTESNFERARMKDTDLCRATLIETSFVGATLSRSLFRDAKLWAADLERANLFGCDFSGAAMVGVVLKSADMRETKMMGASLSGANMSKANLTNASLINADLSGANLLGAELHGTLVMEADLANAKMWDAQLVDTDFRNASLLDASMIGARLERADLTGANLRGLDLSGCILLGAKVLASPTLLRSASGCRIDFDTYTASGWGPDELAEWVEAGAELIDRDRFPPEALARARGAGLTIFVSGMPAPFDRFVIDAVAFCLLGLHTDCQVVEAIPLSEGGFLRITCADGESLELLGEALSRHIWRREDPPHLQGLLRMPDVFDGLERLALRIVRMELRGSDEIDLNAQTAPGPEIDSASSSADREPGRPRMVTLRTWTAA